MVKTLKFADIEVPAPGLGLMGMSQSFGPSNDADSLKTMEHAVSIGCTFWDTAVVYGQGHNETLVGRFFAANPGAREKVFLASKCGLACLGESTEQPWPVTNKPEHIRKYIEGTRERVGSYPDLYYLHRIDPDTPIEESVATLEELRKAGKTRYIGLSECSVETLRRACKVAKIDALQIEYSPWETSHERNGLIDAAKELGVTVVAYSPLGRGMLTGQYKSAESFVGGANDIRSTLPKYTENLAENLKLVEAVEGLAAKKGCTPGQLSIAWVMARGFVPIPGTRKISRLDDNFASREVVLTKEEDEELTRISRELAPVGARYGPAQLKLIGK